MNREISAAADEAMARVAANVRHWREVRGWTQAALANAVGVEPLTIRSLEGARQKPRFTTLVKLAVVLEIDIAELFKQRDHERRKPGRPRGR